MVARVSKLMGLIVLGTVAASGAARSECTDTATAICLNDGRFRVSAHFETNQGQEGEAQTVRLTSDTAYLWFFNPNNVEMVVKVLSGCGLNNRYWVFAGGLTNVRVELEVEDTDTAAVKNYVNPQGTAFQPLQDTSAFATCP